MKKRAPIFIITILVAVGIVWFLRSTHGASDEKMLVLHGNVDIREVNLGFRVSGRLKEVLKDEGDAVKAGDLLAKLDDQPYLHELEEARDQAGALQAKLELLQAGNRPQEIAQARAQVHEREVTLANAERIFKRQQRLLESRTVSIQERDDAEAAYREGEARLNSAREQLNLLEAGFRAEDIAQAKANLANAQAATEMAALHVQDTTLLAPAEGVILTRAQEPGAILQSGATIFTVSLQRPVWVRAYVPETELGRIHPGMNMRVYSDSSRGKTYSGKVGYISPRAEFTPKSVETSELRTSLVYRLRIVVDDPDDGLRQGMPVTATIAN